MPLTSTVLLRADINALTPDNGIASSDVSCSEQHNLRLSMISVQTSATFSLDSEPISASRH